MTILPLSGMPQMCDENYNSLVLREEFPVSKDETVFRGTIVESVIRCLNSFFRNLHLRESAFRETPISDIFERVKQCDSLKILTIIKRIALDSPQRGRQLHAFNRTMLEDSIAKRVTACSEDL